MARLSEEPITFTPKIKANKFHLLLHHETLGCFTKLALIPALPFVIFVLLRWTIPAVLFGVLLLAAIGFIVFATAKIAEIFENALLTASIVVSKSPLQILALTNRNKGGTDEPILALKLVQFDNIPCHSCAIGQVIPCVSGFHDKGSQRAWDNFDPEPLSFATGNKAVLRANTELLDEKDIALLREHIKNQTYPTERDELQWLTNKED